MGNIQSFTEIIDTYTPTESESLEILPFCHTTTAGFAVNIVLSKHAIPMHCGEYKEDLLYLFYGKASYLIDDKLYDYTDNPPITFIFDSDTVKKNLIKRLLPFDSGGFLRYKFKNGFLKENFTYLKPSILKILAYIKLIYKDHQGYIDEEINTDELKTHQDNCLEIKEMIKMYDLAGQGLIPSGPQLYSIEVQFDEKIAFKPSHIVLPFDAYTSKYWGENFRKDFPDIKIEHYGQKEIIDKKGKALQAGEYQFLMRNKVNELMKASIHYKN